MYSCAVCEDSEVCDILDVRWSPFAGGSVEAIVESVDGKVEVEDEKSRRLCCCRGPTRARLLRD